MKLRLVPEDFQVQEQSSLACEQHGPYGVYMLAKTGHNTMDALARAAAYLGVPYGLFRYGGLKDRWAVTEQVVTVRTERDCSGDWDGFSLRYLGRASGPMTPSHIVANRFRVTVRDLGQAEAGTALSRAGFLRAYGFANYFDDQRFGSMREGPVFAGELLVRRRWAQALEALLALPGPDDPPAARRHRRELARRWGDWPACLEVAAGAAERRVFTLLLSQPGAARAAVNLVPREVLALHLAAWQSHLWNEALRRVVRDLASRKPAGAPLSSHPGAAGTYLFPAWPDQAADLSGKALPTLGRGLSWPEPALEGLYRGFLAPLGLGPDSFVLRGLPKVQLRSSLRFAVVVPSAFSLAGPSPDEHHPGRLKLELGFGLPAGSYGTMLVKALLPANL